MKRYLIPLLLVLLTASAFAEDVLVGKFSAADLSGWEDQPFKGKTSYSLVTDNGKMVLKASSFHAASGLIKKVKLSVSEYQTLRWSWKIDHPLKKEDVNTKRGDDFAARIYVVFPKTSFPKLFPWKVRAICYVWASKLPKDAHVPSPRTANSIDVAVESGGDKAGSWVTEERNIYEDYRKFFGEEPPALGAVALMTDTDDSQDEATAWYGDISLTSVRQVQPGTAPVVAPPSIHTPLLAPVTKPGYHPFDLFTTLKPAH